MNKCKEIQLIVLRQQIQSQSKLSIKFVLRTEIHTGTQVSTFPQS